jgi:hypothetical protein
MMTMPLRGLVDPPNDLGEKFTMKVGKEDAERVGAAGDQAAGGAVRAVAHPLSDFAHPAAGGLLDEGAAVLNSGHRGDGDTSRTGYILDRDHRDGRGWQRLSRLPRSGVRLNTDASAMRRRARRPSCNRLHFFYNFVKTA